MICFSNNATVQDAKSQATGKYRLENTTKNHLPVDSDGLPIEFTVIGGEVHASTAASKPLEHLSSVTAMLIAELGQDRGKISDQIDSTGINAVVPSKSSSVIENTDMNW